MRSIPHKGIDLYFFAVLKNTPVICICTDKKVSNLAYID